MIGKLASPDFWFDVCVVILLSSCHFSFHFLFCIVAAEFTQFCGWFTWLEAFDKDDLFCRNLT
jgi:hypothetical protein